MTEVKTPAQLRFEQQAQRVRLERASDFWNNMAYGSAGSAAVLMVLSQSPAAKLSAGLLAGTAAVCYGLHAWRESKLKFYRQPPLQSEHIAKPTAQYTKRPQLSLQQQYDTLKAAADYRPPFFAANSILINTIVPFNLIPISGLYSLPAAITSVTVPVMAASAVYHLYASAGVALRMQKVANFKCKTGFKPNESTHA